MVVKSLLLLESRVWHGLIVELAMVGLRLELGRRVENVGHLRIDRLS